MIDDGKHDPPEIKIEDSEFALYSIAMWEVDFMREGIDFTVGTVKKRKRDRFWRLMEAVGRTFVNGDRPTNMYGGFYE